MRFTGQHEEALNTIRQAVDGLVAVLGDEHPYTLAAKMVMGVLLADQGDLEEAEKLEAHTAEALARVLTPDHPDTLRCRANLLLTRQQRGDRTAATQRAAAIDQLAVQLGENHPDVNMLREERRLMRSLDPQPF
jgi:Lhr-like helicase